ncbi:phosphoglucosamine mutase [Halorubrum halodurans]|uniref:Phosphoglucosamine mutase n=1 Tax=Halorubrum halodurans TaxID=1383851 RepID=A0A256IKQ3_9EURY|nr:phosphoglucosamine mutase [Halorubrum halodurans]OYR57095.1 phosphoglucosamine mutase [Halorubrum halodurans]
MFGTSGIRGRVGEEVTAAVALDVGRAVGTETDRVVVGRDARGTGETLRDALVAGLRETGADVVDVGRAATPTVARAIDTRDADAGVVVTASHNPAPDNGLKLWTPSGQAYPPARQDVIEERIREGAFDLADWTGQGGYDRWNAATDRHRDALVAAGEHAAETRGTGAPGADPLADLSVVVDAGNGMGGVTADALHDLGAAVETLNATPDGRFPARPSEPTAENCATLAATVEAVDADLGIAHDGDADRMMAVTDAGEFVPGDLLLAVFGRAAAGEGDRVAAPVDTSLAAADALAEVGAELVYTRVGDVYVAERAAEAGVAFGGEPSGAWIFPEETLCPDGPLAAVRLAALATSTPLSERVAAMERYPIRRRSVETEHKAAAMELVAARVTDEFDEVSTLDGVRVDADEGWFLLRASGTEPLIRVTAEAREADAADALLERASGIVDRALADAAGD